jgi:hypothetical protein
MNKLVKGIVTSSPDSYVPLNVPVNIQLDKNGLIHGVHRIEGGSGTYIPDAWMRKRTVWTELKEQLTAQDHLEAAQKISDNLYKLETGEQHADAIAQYEYHIKMAEQLKNERT